MSTHATQGRNKTDRRDHYAEVTEQVIRALEAGTPPWCRPWDNDKASGPAAPRNAITGTRNRGINTVVFGMSQLAFSSGDPRLATYKFLAMLDRDLRQP